jgi:hypothetical protein
VIIDRSECAGSISKAGGVGGSGSGLGSNGGNGGDGTVTVLAAVILSTFYASTYP